MKLTTEEVRYVADLANMRLTEEEISHLSQELGQILTYIEQLNELDTGQVAPMAQVFLMPMRPPPCVRTAPTLP